MRVAWKSVREEKRVKALHLFGWDVDFEKYIYFYASANRTECSPHCCWRLYRRFELFTTPRRRAVVYYTFHWQKQKWKIERASERREFTRWKRAYTKGHFWFNQEKYCWFFIFSKKLFSTNTFFNFDNSQSFFFFLLLSSELYSKK